MDRTERPIEMLPYTPEIRRGENVLPAYHRDTDARRVAHVTAKSFATVAGWLNLEVIDPKEDRGGGRYIPRLRSTHKLFREAEVLVWISPDNKIAHVTVETSRKTMEVDVAGVISNERYKTT